MVRTALSVFLYGISAALAQVVLVRTGMSVLGGSELTIGLFLAAWLCWVAVGAIITARAVPDRATRKWFGFMICIQPVALGCSAMLLRFGHHLMGFPVGEPPRLAYLLAAALLAGAGPGWAAGALYALSVRMIRPGLAYGAEGLGSFAGGLLFTGLLVERVPTFSVVAITIALAVVGLAWHLRRGVLAWLVLIPLAVIPFGSAAEQGLCRAQWRLPGFVAAVESRHAMIVVTRTGDQHNFFLNGSFAYSCPDTQAIEATFHCPLLLHPDPRRVMVIGGGVSTVAGEVSRHADLVRVTYGESDPRLITMDLEYCGCAGHVPVRLAGDARVFLRSHTEPFDVVIVNLPEPQSGMMNRFYTREFFESVQARLRPGGLVAVQLSDPAEIISEDARRYVSILCATLGKEFRYVVALPLDRIMIVAADWDVSQVAVAGAMAEMAQRRGLCLRFANEHYLKHWLTPERLAYVNVRDVKAPVNEDLRPYCYYHGLVRWSRVHFTLLRWLLEWLRRVPWWWLCMPVALLLPLFRGRPAVYGTSFVAGLTSMTLEVVLVLGFQAVEGYAYAWLGLFSGSFMLGLACGVWLGTSYRPLCASPLVGIRIVQAAMVLAIATMSALMATALLQRGLSVVTAMLVIGTLTGALYPLAVDLLGAHHAGPVFGFELLGSCLGALTVSVLFVPVYGMIPTVVLLLFLSLLTLVGLARLRLRR